MSEWLTIANIEQHSQALLIVLLIVAVVWLAKIIVMTVKKRDELAERLMKEKQPPE